MHEPAERGRVADAFADRVHYPDRDADKLTDSVATSHTAPDDGPAQRTLRHRRVGIDRTNTALPVDRPR